MRQMNHPSIVKLLQFFESNEHYFLVMECALVFPSATVERKFIVASDGGW